MRQKSVSFLAMLVFHERVMQQEARVFTLLDFGLLGFQ